MPLFGKSKDKVPAKVEKDYDHLHGTHPSQTFSAEQPATSYPGGPVPGGEYGTRDPYTGPGVTHPMGRTGEQTFTQPGIGHTQETRHFGATGAQGGTAHTTGGRTGNMAGGLLGSEPLKAKALQKEREAGAVRLQERDLIDAERLEQEAMKKRQHAVAQGADPANARLGAGNQDGLGY